MSDPTERLIHLAQERLRTIGVSLQRLAAASGGLGTAGDPQVDAVVTLSYGGTEARYAVAVKTSMTLSSLANSKSFDLPYPLLVLGDRISRRSAAAFRDAGVQFIDTAGNAFIAFDGVLIDVQGRTEPNAPQPPDSDSARQPHQPSNIFSPRRSQVVLALLAWPRLRAGKVRDIAGAAGVSVGQAHDALMQLKHAGFIVPPTGRLLRAGELLDFWTAAYPASLGRQLDIAAYHGDPSKTIRTTDPGEPIYLSGEAAEGTSLARPAKLTLYVDALDRRLPIANRWSRSPERAPNIFIRRKFWVSPCADGEDATGLERNAPWPLVYADLIATGDARLREVAKEWRSRCARPDDV